MATINRYTIQGSIVVDQRPLTPPTPRYQVTITGGYLDDDPAKTSASYEEGSTVAVVVSKALARLRGWVIIIVTGGII